MGGNLGDLFVEKLTEIATSRAFRNHQAKGLNGLRIAKGGRELVGERGQQSAKLAAATTHRRRHSHRGALDECLNYMDEQLLLAAEVAVQRLFRHASLSSDHVHRGCLVAMDREDVERDIQDLRPFGGSGSGWTTSHCFGSPHFVASENLGRREGSCQERQKRLNHTA